MKYLDLFRISILEGTRYLTWRGLLDDGNIGYCVSSDGRWIPKNDDDFLTDCPDEELEEVFDFLEINNPISDADIIFQSKLSNKILFTMEDKFKEEIDEHTN